ncbi:pentapeptide repeat-containing protein [Scytonema hofmannii FACHB-248]|uniref:Pentapeptide repeat-containing protein n=1 Tax=Scytonema hofmannii FACHB-248 TaxID=1842502 RepID=A0ABR8GLW2_9CYAN|nr:MULTISPECIES: pentapeptide repeat-containing protein [Nostocales]MBD2604184.1 pentapeptide repeat-containing protein [Scytonema hofmannii FACHB-248]
MTIPSVRRSNHQTSHSKEPDKSNFLPLGTKRIAAWVAEITLVVTSGLIPFGMGVYANSRSDLDRVPLNPVLVVTERAIAQPLALPISYGTRNVAWATNFLWTVALLAPLTVSGWQLYLLAKTGSTIPKRWFGVRVVNEKGAPPGFGAVLVREGIGRWTVPMSIAYLVWRYSLFFPNLSVFTGLVALLWLAEGIGLPSKQKPRRALHDRLAGTYTIDATRPFTPPNESQPSLIQDEEQAIALEYVDQPKLWGQIGRNPSLPLFAVAVVSMVAVLGTLVGTQVYIQTQQTKREADQGKRQQFLSLEKLLTPNSTATDEERRSAILAMGTLNNPQAMQFLVSLLAKETNPILLDTIQQALVNIGPEAIPDLKRMNQFLAGEMDANSNSPQDKEMRQTKLYINQRAINKILAVNSSRIDSLDLSRTQLGQSSNGNSSNFNLVLNNVDLSGINFKFASLNSASFKSSRFRGVGEDGRWDTYDDSIADLSGAQIKQANLSDANLSRVLMIGTDLRRATLNRANLSNARLVGAKLGSAQLVGADLRGAVLENASLTGADLGEAKLNEANLYAASLSRVIAIGTQLSFANLTKTNWQGSDLSGAYLDRANLSDANLSATRLTGAILRSAQMSNVNLRNADLSLADLRGANLTGADFQGAILAPSKQDPADQFVQTPAMGAQSAVVQGVDFTQVKNLDPKQLAYICTQGGIHPRCP